MTDVNDLNPEKVRQLIANAWSALDPADRAERFAHDIEHGVPGVTMHPQGEAIEFVRGGRTLALVHRDLLCGDGPLDADAEFVADDIDADIERLLDEDNTNGGDNE
ncbi:hypothetical protein [Mycobacterium sp. 1274761.0]|uniref:hypothetical protein n=1 Tax=Mycobacterium sp. 1274761.0 TaxID=1834077 RepID=UPI0007FFE3C5|nr:hypothetical protein [Mycobacterium sp. 1274761.0]OBK74857.1 hypothetical protein A5651_08125 [Mycobacterium sp. 1274761.0]